MENTVIFPYAETSLENCQHVADSLVGEEWMSDSLLRAAVSVQGLLHVVQPKKETAGRANRKQIGFQLFSEFHICRTWMAVQPPRGHFHCHPVSLMRHTGFPSSRKANFSLCTCVAPDSTCTSHVC